MNQLNTKNPKILSNPGEELRNPRIAEKNQNAGNWANGSVSEDSKRNLKPSFEYLSRLWVGGLIDRQKANQNPFFWVSLYLSYWTSLLTSTVDSVFFLADDVLYRWPVSHFGLTFRFDPSFYMLSHIYLSCEYLPYLKKKKTIFTILHGYFQKKKNW